MGEQSYQEQRTEVATIAAEAIRKLVNESPRTPSLMEMVRVIFEAFPVDPRYWSPLEQPAKMEVQTGTLPPPETAPKPGKVTLYDSYEDRTVIHRREGDDYEHHRECIEDQHGNKAVGQNMIKAGCPSDARVAILRRYLSKLLPDCDGKCVFHASTQRFEITIGKFQLWVQDDLCVPLEHMARMVQRQYDNYCTDEAQRRAVAVATADRDWIFFHGMQWNRHVFMRMCMDEEFRGKVLKRLANVFGVPGVERVLITHDASKLIPKRVS